VYEKLRESPCAFREKSEETVTKLDLLQSYNGEQIRRWVAGVMKDEIRESPNVAIHALSVRAVIDVSVLYYSL